jgi:hypothetical protein
MAVEAATRTIGESQTNSVCDGRPRLTSRIQGTLTMAPNWRNVRRPRDRSMTESQMTPTPPQREPTRRHVLLALPAVAVSEAVVPSSAVAIETPSGSVGNDKYDSDHIRRFYELARF